jgi:Flp pilus assembly protein TadD
MAGAAREGGPAVPVCPHCEKPVEATDAFCRHCGAALGSAASPERDGFMEQMAADFQGRLKDQPRNPDALYNLALSRLYGGQVAEAAACLRQVIALVPDFADAHGKLAVCLWRLGDPEAARAAIRAAVDLAPRDRRLADLRARMGES